MSLFRLSQTCCTSPAAMWFWAAAFAVLYGAGLLVGFTSPVFEPYGDTLLLAALGAACVINFGRNRTFHCGLTGPLFLVAAIVAALIEAGIRDVSEEALWGVVLVGVALAFLIEWRAVGREGTLRAPLTLKSTSGLILTGDERLLRFAGRGTGRPCLRHLR